MVCLLQLLQMGRLRFLLSWLHAALISESERVMRDIETWDPFQGSILLKEIASYAALTISLKNNPLRGTLTSNNRYYVVDDSINPFEFWNVFLTALYNETGRISLMTHVFNDLRFKKTIHIISGVNNCGRPNANFIKKDDANCVIEFSVPCILELKRGRDYELLNINEYDKGKIKTIDLIEQHGKKWFCHNPSSSVHGTLEYLTRALIEQFCSFFQCASYSERELANRILFYIIAFSYPSADFPKKIITILNPNCYTSINREFSSGGVFVVWQPSCDLHKLLETDSYIEFSLKSKLHFLQETTRDLLSYSSFEATRSAIGSIMSRNGSHNIGSHVLAALSHNVGTMPDDRVLYQYIQHRMDYIATATTDFPTWSSAEKLVNGLMRRFLSQRHLLDYIASSEGLHAYKFQDPNISVDAEQLNTIRLRIRNLDKLDSNGTPHEFIEYKDIKATADFDEDVAVAIPGGVIGGHAFFTILENVIRNAAKHGWAKTSDKQKNYLEIFVDFKRGNSNRTIEVDVYDGLSDVFAIAKKIIVPKEGGNLTPEENATNKAIENLCAEINKWKVCNECVRKPLATSKQNEDERAEEELLASLEEDSTAGWFWHDVKDKVKRPKLKTKRRG